MFYGYTLLLITVFVGGSLGVQVSVGVYYEPLCGDCKQFIVDQLKPSYERNRDGFKIQLVPYGKTKTDNKSDGTVTFECTLGEVGCKACLIHSCAIHHVKDEAQLVKYISCMMTNEGNQQPSEIGKTCAAEFGIDWDTIESCSNNEEGINFLNSNGEMTKLLDPAITNIPTILINNIQADQTVLEDFRNFAEWLSSQNTTRVSLSVLSYHDLKTKLQYLDKDRIITMTIILAYTNATETKTKNTLEYFEKQAKLEENSDFLFVIMNVTAYLKGDAKTPIFNFLTKDGSINEMFNDIDDENQFLQKIAEYKKILQLQSKTTKLEPGELIYIWKTDQLTEIYSQLNNNKLTMAVLLFYSDKTNPEACGKALEYCETQAKNYSRDVMFCKINIDHGEIKSGGRKSPPPVFQFIMSDNLSTFYDIDNEDKFLAKFKEFKKDKVQQISPNRLIL